MTTAVEQWARLVTEEWGLYQDIPEHAVSTVLGLIEQESGGDPTTLHSLAGVVGLAGVIGRDAPGFQPAPEWLRWRPTMEELKQPKVNIRTGIRIFHDNLARCGRLDKALVAYYTGDCEGWLKSDASGTTGAQYQRLVLEKAQAYRTFDLPPSTSGAEKPAQPQPGAPQSLLDMLAQQVEALKKVDQEQQRTLQRQAERIATLEEGMAVLRRGAAIMGGKG